LLRGKVEMTVTESVRNLKSIFDRIARIVPGSPHLAAIEAMGGLYRTLPEDAAKGWIEDGRSKATIADVARYAGEDAVFLSQRSIAARLQKRGRGASFRLQDAWMARQAIQPGYRLLTRDADGFKDTPGLDIVVFGTRPTAG
jgi:hypothetical protein